MSESNNTGIKVVRGVGGGDRNDLNSFQIIIPVNPVQYMDFSFASNRGAVDLRVALPLLSAGFQQ